MFETSFVEVVRPKILIAEDHAAFREVLSERLRAEGYDVVEVSNGVTLADVFSHSLDDDDNPRSPDLVLSDIRMPGGSGLVALEQLRRDDPMTPVILMTAFGDAETHLLARRLGANEVIDKPVRLQDLVALVRRYVPPATGSR
jgi:CheY-like chemotaxis protein